MAREVNTVLAQIIAEQRNIPESNSEDIVKSMRSANQYQVRNLYFIDLPDGYPLSSCRSSVDGMHMETPSLIVPRVCLGKSSKRRLITFIGGRLVISTSKHHWFI
jgi:hypothetical protein